MSSFTVLVKTRLFQVKRALDESYKWNSTNTQTLASKLCELQSHLGSRAISGFQLVLAWVEAVIEMGLAGKGMGLNVFQVGPWKFRGTVYCSVQNQYLGQKKNVTGIKGVLNHARDGNLGSSWSQQAKHLNEYFFHWLILCTHQSNCYSEK